MEPESPFGSALSPSDTDGLQTSLTLTENDNLGQPKSEVATPFECAGETGSPLRGVPPGSIARRNTGRRPPSRLVRMVRMRRISHILCQAFAALAVSHAATPSSITLSSSSASTRYGAPVALVATVSPPAATGKITFYSGVSVLGIAAISSGQATLTSTFLQPGNRSIRGYYSGDANNAPSISAPFSLTVRTVPGAGIQSTDAFCQPEFSQSGIRRFQRRWQD